MILNYFDFLVTSKKFDCKSPSYWLHMCLTVSKCDENGAMLSVCVSGKETWCDPAWCLSILKKKNIFQLCFVAKSRKSVGWVVKLLVGCKSETVWDVSHLAYI